MENTKIKLKPINNADLEESSDNGFVNTCILPMICDSDVCKGGGGWCIGVCNKD